MNGIRTHDPEYTQMITTLIYDGQCLHFKDFSYDISGVVYYRLVDIRALESEQNQLVKPTCCFPGSENVSVQCR